MPYPVVVYDKQIDRVWFVDFLGRYLCTGVDEHGEIVILTRKQYERLITDNDFEMEILLARLLRNTRVTVAPPPKG